VAISTCKQCQSYAQCFDELYDDYTALLKQSRGLSRTIERLRELKHSAPKLDSGAGDPRGVRRGRCIKCNAEHAYWHPCPIDSHSKYYCKKCKAV